MTSPNVAGGYWNPSVPAKSAVPTVSSTAMRGMEDFVAPNTTSNMERFVGTNQTPSSVATVSSDNSGQYGVNSSGLSSGSSSNSNDNGGGFLSNLLGFLGSPSTGRAAQAVFREEHNWLSSIAYAGNAVISNFFDAPKWGNVLENAGSVYESITSRSLDSEFGGNRQAAIWTTAGNLLASVVNLFV